MLAQVDGGSILLLGAVLLACGSAGLMVVRLSNPRLMGLGWLGAGFASGGCGVLLLALSGLLPKFFAVVLSDSLVLLTFVLLQVAVLEMRRERRLFPLLGAGLVVFQVAAYVMMTYVHPDARGRVMLLGILVAVQLGETVVHLIRGMGRGVRMPTWFTAVVLMGLMGMNLFRSVALMFVPAFRVPGHALELQTATFLVFIVTAMGIAFGFFWMTTAELSYELEQMASTDPLTRLYNRRVFCEWMQREIARSRGNPGTFSVLMMDLDHFKQINDRFGHSGGDEMLCAAVERMQDAIRGIDVLGRWGGEEFVALLPGAGQEAALMVAQRVRKNVEGLLLRTPRGMAWEEVEGMSLTVSLGVATYRGEGDVLEDIVRRADEALYLAKAAGRNQALALA